MGVSAALCGCSAGRDLPAAEAEIGKFHAALNQGRFDVIYADSGTVMKHAATPAASGTFLAAIHRKLGPFLTGKRQFWRENYTTRGHFLSIGYGAQYRNGAAQELFGFQLDGARPKLASYNINSTALVLN